VSKPRDPDLTALYERVARLEESNAWIKRKLEVIDRRTWYVLASVVVFGVVSIIIAVAGRVL